MSELSLAAEKAYEQAKGDSCEAARLLMTVVLNNERFMDEVVRNACDDLIRRHRGDMRRKSWQQATTKGLPAIRIDEDFKKVLDERIEKKYRKCMMSDFTLPNGLALAFADRENMKAAVNVWRRNKEGNAKREKFGSLILEKLKEGEQVKDCFTENQLIVLCRKADLDPFGQEEKKTPEPVVTNKRRARQG